jgi:MFS family permease
MNVGVMPSRRAPSEGWIVFLVGAVQFINIWDFVMVMPLGPDFAGALGIPLSHLGLLGGAYTAAAALAGIAGSTFLDRFDRRPALAVAMTGLVLGPSPAPWPRASRRSSQPGSSPARSVARPPRCRCRSSPTWFRPSGGGRRWGR